MATEIEPFYAALGRRVQRLRHAKGMTQAELGQRLVPPVTRASIANLESGKQRVLVHTLVDLAQLLGVKVTKLMPKPLKAHPERDVEKDLAAALPIGPDELRALVAQLDAHGRDS